MPRGYWLSESVCVQRRKSLFTHTKWVDLGIQLGLYETGAKALQIIYLFNIYLHAVKESKM